MGFTNYIASTVNGKPYWLHEIGSNAIWIYNVSMYNNPVCSYSSFHVNYTSQVLFVKEEIS